jgi:phage recombination protein Bet
MSAELAVVQNFSDEQIELIRKQVAPQGTTKDELAMFLHYAQRTGLDPFSRQIYLSERKSQVQGQWVATRKPEVTIDGFRLVAERTRQYAGQLGPFWCGEDGEWKDVWIPSTPPTAAKIGVLRHDFKEPVWSVALYREYAQMKSDGKPNSMWTKYPSVMLAKCAESLALRRAFPRELSGLYTREEMPEDMEPRKSKDEAHQDQKQVAEAKISQLKEKRGTPKPGAATEDLLKSYLRRAATDAPSVYAELGDELEKIGGQDFADQCWAQAIAQADPIESPNEVVTLLYRALRTNQEPAA